MLMILFIIITLVGAGLVHRAEVQRGIPQPPTSLIGQWPFNILLLVGIAVFLLTDGRSFEITAKAVVVIATALFYTVKLYRISRS